MLDPSERWRDMAPMSRDLIRKRLAGPGPFVLRTSDGKEFLVPHSEFVLIGRHNIVVEDSKGRLDIIDPMHVVSIQHRPRKSPNKARA